MRIERFHVVLGAYEWQDLHEFRVEEVDIVAIFKQDIGAMVRVIIWHSFH